MKMYALKQYIDLNLGNPNAILKKGANNTIEQNGVYKGALSALKRTEAEQLDNNLARQQLLRALADAFEYGAAHGRGENGRLRFTDTFLEHVEERLGKSIFKLEDFGIDKKGYITSGKPLTQRRVKAIMDKMTEIANKSNKPGWEKTEEVKKRPAFLGLKIKSNLKGDGSASLSDIAANAKTLRAQVYMNEAGRNASGTKDEINAKIEKHNRKLTEEQKAHNLEFEEEKAEERAIRKERKAAQKPSANKLLKSFIKDINKQTHEAFVAKHGEKTEANQAKLNLHKAEHDAIVEQEVMRDNLRFAARREEKMQIIAAKTVAKENVIIECEDEEDPDNNAVAEVNNLKHDALPQVDEVKHEHVQDETEARLQAVTAEHDAVVEELLNEFASEER